jgi:hypothetical protein
MQDLSLEKIDAVRLALDKATTIQEVKKVLDAALAIEVFIKHQKGTREAEQRAIEAILRSWFKLGEMLQAAKATGQFGKGYQFHQSNIPKENSTTFTLKEAGIDPKLSMLAQQIASVGKDEFEKAISDGKAAGKLAKNMFSKKPAPQPYTPQPQPQKPQPVKSGVAPADAARPTKPENSQNLSPIEEINKLHAKVMSSISKLLTEELELCKLGELPPSVDALFYKFLLVANQDKFCPECHALLASLEGEEEENE